MFSEKAWFRAGESGRDALCWSMASPQRLQHNRWPVLHREVANIVYHCWCCCFYALSSVELVPKGLLQLVSPNTPSVRFVPSTVHHILLTVNCGKRSRKKAWFGLTSSFGPAPALLFCRLGIGTGRLKATTRICLWHRRVTTLSLAKFIHLERVWFVFVSDGPFRWPLCLVA